MLMFQTLARTQFFIRQLCKWLAARARCSMKRSESRSGGWLVNVNFSNVLARNFSFDSHAKMVRCTGKVLHAMLRVAIGWMVGQC